MPKKGEKHLPETIKKISDSRKGQPSPTRGIKKTRLQKEKISIGRKGIFQWIDDKDFVALLIRDFATASICFKDGLIKPAIILHAGILEAILKYRLRIDDTFENLINKAGEKKIIDDSSIHKLHTLRDFRNYIHLHRELKRDFELTNGIAQLAQETCILVVNELRESAAIMRAKIKDDISENKKTLSSKKFILYKELEEKILDQVHKKIGGEMKRQIHFVYGYPDRPEFQYTPDGVIRKGNDIIFIEIKHLINSRFKENVIGSGLQTLRMILGKFSKHSDPKGKLKALLVIVSPHNLGPGYTLKGQNIKVEFVKT